MNRRRFLAASCAGLIGAGASGLSRAGDVPRGKGPRVVVIGGGFGGATCAKYLRLIDARLEVVLVERRERYVCCPFSNLVLSGAIGLDRLTLDYGGLAQRHGIVIMHREVNGIDAVARRVAMPGGWLGYDRLVVAPGLEIHPEGIEGYDPLRTPEVMPHAWKAGDQTLLLRRQLLEMRDGGTVVVAIPRAPYTCPPGPYERICQIAFYLKRNKPKSKIVVLDANADVVAKGVLFKQAWEDLYRGMVEYRPDQTVRRVDTGARMLHTDVERVSGEVVNLIPPQRPAAVAREAGLTGKDGTWCPVEPVGFESRRLAGVHVVGDACSAGAMPKSAFSASSQAKAVAHNIAALLSGREPEEHHPINACYSFVDDREAMSVAGVYRPQGGDLVAVPGAGGVSRRYSQAEGDHARSWLANMLADSFG